MPDGLQRLGVIVKVGFTASAPGIAEPSTTKRPSWVSVSLAPPPSKTRPYSSMAPGVRSEPIVQPPSGWVIISLCRAITRIMALSWYFLCPLGCSSVLVNQAIDDLPALDPGGHIDRFAGLVQRRSLLPRLVRPMLVAVPRVFGQSPPEMLFAVDQQAVEALAP